MNNHFTEVTKQLNLKMGVLSHSKPLENIISTFKGHESIHRIVLATSTALDFFWCCYATEEEDKKEILNISSKKVPRMGDIPAKVLKAFIDTYLKDWTVL